MLDMIVADHLSKLYKEIRNQALIQVLCVCEQCVYVCVYMCVCVMGECLCTHTYTHTYVCVCRLELAALHGTSAPGVV